MSLKKNELWKLDYLEAKLYKKQPRFSHTKKLLGAKNNAQLLKKLPSNEEDANTLISALKSEYFERKYFGGHKKLEKEVKKVIHADLKKFATEDLKKSIISFFENDENIGLLVTSKLIKLIMITILNRKELNDSPPEYISPFARSIITNKSNTSHPSAFFKNNCQSDQPLNNYISNLWNSKALRSLLAEIEWSFRLIRGDITKVERDKRNIEKPKDSKLRSDDDDTDDSGSEGSDEDDSEEDYVKEKPEFEAECFEDAYDKFAIYDDLVAGSDVDEEVELDDKVDYTQLTDEEPSESESETDPFFEQEMKVKEKKAKSEAKVKHKLPELASGYYSGGSDEEDDVDNDKVVKLITTVRKNRRGQRARQKIWEQKYGKEAVHVKEERKKVASEREQRQTEYEERERKRQLKAKLALENAPSGSNVQPIGKRIPGSSVPAETKEMHPSWIAKKMAEEKQKNVKFAGKKITFD